MNIEIKIIGQRLMFLVVFCLLIFSCKEKHAESKEVVIKEANQTKEGLISTVAKKYTIICFGNSLTAGLGLDEKEAWPTLLNNRMDSLGLDYKVVNAGISGETSSGGLNRIDWVLKQQMDIFILELGGNDMLRGLDINVTEVNLRKLLTKVHEKNPGIPIIIAGMLAPPNMGEAYEKQFKSIFVNLAKDYNGRLIPFFLENIAGIDSLNQADKIHPNSKGQKIILENVWKQLKEVI